MYIAYIAIVSAFSDALDQFLYTLKHLFQKCIYSISQYNQYLDVIKVISAARDISIDLKLFGEVLYAQKLLYVAINRVIIGRKRVRSSRDVSESFCEFWYGRVLPHSWSNFTSKPVRIRSNEMRYLREYKRGREFFNMARRSKASCRSFQFLSEDRLLGYINSRRTP